MMFGKPILLPATLPKVQTGTEKANSSYTKRVVVDLSQEYEEDMELLDMLNGNDSKIFYIKIQFILFRAQGRTKF